MQVLVCFSGGYGPIEGNVFGELVAWKNAELIVEGSIYLGLPGLEQLAPLGQLA